MNTLALSTIARKHFDVGYALYRQNLGLEHCQNDAQRKGWNSAQRGHMACTIADTAFALGGDASQADEAVRRWA